jgi:hypothetical protein
MKVGIRQVDGVTIVDCSGNNSKQPLPAVLIDVEHTDD